MKKFLSVLMTVCIIISVSAAVFAAEQPVTIRVGIDTNRPPFAYREDYHNQRKGFDVAFMVRIAEMLNYNVEFMEMDYKKLMPAVVSGEIDCAASGIVITGEENETIDFTAAYLTCAGDNNMDAESYGIAFKKGSELYPAVNEAVKELVHNGVAEEFGDLYGIKNIVYSAEVPSLWAKESVDIANESGIIDKAERYIYKKPISREMFCEFVYNLAGVLNNTEIPSAVTNNFTDTDNEKVLALNSFGIINGKSSSEFAPDDVLTREEAAVIICRIIEKLMPVQAEEKSVVFLDENEISDWASDSVQKICSMDIMKGLGAGAFSPKGIFTVEEAIVTLVRVFEYKG